MRTNTSMSRYRHIALLLSALGLAACGEKTIQQITAPVDGPLVKFFNFSVGAPSVNFYSGTTKVTGVSGSACAPPNDTTATCRSTGTETTSGTAYTGAGNGGLYAQLTAGTATLTGKIISAASDNGTVIGTASAPLAAGTFYSYYLSGIYNTTTKTTDAFIVTDAMPAADLNNAYVRFVNAISNSSPMTLYAKLQSSGAETGVGTATQAYKDASSFVQLAPGVYDLNTRTAGSSTNVITRAAVSFVAGHVYTIAARGDMVSTVTANKPALDNTANR